MRAETLAKEQTRVVSEISKGLERLAADDLSQHIASPKDDPFPQGYDGLRISYNQVLDEQERQVRKWLVWGGHSHRFLSIFYACVRKAMFCLYIL